MNILGEILGWTLILSMYLLAGYLVVILIQRSIMESQIARGFKKLRQKLEQRAKEIKADKLRRN